ncbi:hypothetical protein LCGC14_0524510 [marine sediment metagenome]|uniref:SpoVT-AbrB domain-containing protein n=1 Tax=marine sediment metagenome TaxID=412755 RepID=A0A0F9UIU1_9ZZZZ
MVLNVIKMNGETTKYYVYETTSGRINIPKNVAKMLNWDHKDDIGVILKTIDGKQGLFLWKREKTK